MPAPLVYAAALSGWTHITVVYENRQPKLYINGALVRTGLTSPMSVVHLNPWSIGGQVYGYYAGKLDEVKVYNRALSASEVSTLMSGGSSTTYRASTQFSNTQGQNNWYYVDENNALMTYDSANNVWAGSEGPYQWLWASGGHPGGAHDSVRQWRATAAGSIHITGSVADGDPGGGDGIVATIKKGSTILWQQTIANGNTTGLTYDLTTTVVAGSDKFRDQP
jgi:hypothetical protein